MGFRKPRQDLSLQSFLRFLTLRHHQRGQSSRTLPLSRRLHCRLALQSRSRRQPPLVGSHPGFQSLPRPAGFRRALPMYLDLRYLLTNVQSGSVAVPASADSRLVCEVQWRPNESRPVQSTDFDPSTETKAHSAKRRGIAVLLSRVRKAPRRPVLRLSRSNQQKLPRRQGLRTRGETPVVSGQKKTPRLAGPFIICSDGQLDRDL
jgi:hypothetical protein